MKKNLIACISLLFLFFAGEKAYAKGKLFVGGNLGFDYATGVDGPNPAVVEEGMLYGGTIKYFFEHEPRLGFGGSFNVAPKGDNTGVSVNSEAVFYTWLYDVMYNFSSNDSIEYVSLSIGRSYETLDSDYNYHYEGQSPVYGVGLGMIYDAREPGFKVGGEIRYLLLTDADLNGFLEGYITLGYLF
ncbi:MAG: hypothetical protein HYV24_11625 [Deltaproteobacteria bacterium]|nr:hypothetical protein [Deltaproteobacteria bacterium]